MKASTRVVILSSTATTTTRHTSVRTASAAMVVKMELTIRCCSQSHNVTTSSGVLSTSSRQKRQVVLRDNDDDDDDDGQYNWCRSLGKRWREYQGMGNWEGMLDPLDHNLRHEILRYGNFVQAAYKFFDFQCSRPKKFPSRRKLLTLCGLPHTGYHITRSLRATCGVTLPSWASSWGLVRSSWIGYVAVCNDKAEMDRLGRRDIMIALRGTITALEWMENLRAGLTPVGPDSNNSESGPMVESGFLSLYRSGEPSLQQMVRAEVERLLRSYGDHPPLSVTITGHSMGAALATLAAHDIMTHFRDLLSSKQVMVTVISFGGPRVGNRSFRCQLEEQLGVKVLRIVNSDDLVTKMPGFVVENNAHARVPSWMVYSEVGKELRLSSGRSGFDVVKCHDLKTYLQLL